VPGCGRKTKNGDLCQTHGKHQRKRGTTRAIRRVRPGKRGAVKLHGLSVTPYCAEEVLRVADAKGSTANAVITDVIEEWARGFQALKS